jgi:hypothetical protein
MIRFGESVKAWGTPGFETTLKREIETLGPGQLPLQQAMLKSSVALDRPVSAMIIDVTGDADSIRAKVGVFFAGMIAGCSCADDPTPVDEQSEYCELRFSIRRDTGEVAVTLLPD